MELPRIGIGTAGFSGIYNNITAQECGNIVDKAIANKLNYFDSSPFYGNGCSEKILGNCLTKYNRDKYFISSKAGNCNGQYKYGYYDVTSAVMNSLKNLGIKYFDIVFIADIDRSPSLDYILKESLPALMYLKQNGFVRKIGISGIMLEQLDYIRSKFDIDCIMTYCCYSLINNTLLNYVSKWKNDNITIVQGGVTSMGLLTPQGPPCWHPASDEIKICCRKLNEFCHNKNINIVENAFYYTYLNKDIDIILIGPTAITQLNNYIDWLQQIYSNNKEHILTLVQMARPIQNKLWVDLF